MKKIWENETLVNNNIKSIEENINSFNSKASSLYLIPSTAKNAYGQNYELKLNKNVFFHKI